MEPATYNASQNCRWQINMLDGMYATVVFYKYNKQKEGIFVTYPNMQYEYLIDNDTSPYIFTYPQFQIDLEAGDREGEFSFKVVWSYYPTNLCQNNIDLDASALFPSVPTNCLTTFTAPNRVWLVGFLLQGMQQKELRVSAVYEGDSYNGTYIGNLYDAWNVNVITDGKQMTVYTFGMLNQINRTLFLGMDVEAAGDIDSFIGLDCQDPHISRCSISLPDLGGVIAVVTSSNSVDYLKMMSSFQPDFDLKIYEGQINDDHLLTNVNKSNYYYQFPIAVKDTVKIYKLARNQLTIPLFTNPDDVSYSLVYVGRLVDIHSFYVGQLVYQQDTFENFTTGNPNVLMNFDFKVKYFGYNGPSTTLEITVFRNGNTVFYEKYFEGNLPPTTTIGALGDSATVKYSTFNIYTYGFRVELLCAANNETSTVTPGASSSPSTAKTIPISSSTKIPGIDTTVSSTTITIVKTTTTSYETTTKRAKDNLSFICFSLVLFTLL